MTTRWRTPSGLAMLLVSVAAAHTASGIPTADAWAVYSGGDGPGHGRRIVLISGDEEYRSEEALPQLGKILAVRHGFHCTVLFAIDPETGEIDPDVRTNIPGLEALDDADLMIIATRFRDLPDEQMAHIDAYLRSGRPVIGMRTATHAFNMPSSDTYRKYTWNYEGEEFTQGFGRQILGETWIAHHGDHGRESTRGIIDPSAREHPITRGIDDGDVWGPTDVYRVRLPLPDGRAPVILGQVLAGMSADDEPVVGEKNDPMMPVAWTGRYDGNDGATGRVFATTMGAATDLVAEGTRRMLVNAAYWCLGMEAVLPPGGSDVRLVGSYEPTAFGFGGFRRGVRPEDHALARDDQDEPEGASMRRLEPGSRIVVVGNTFAERLAQSGYFDGIVHATHPDHRLVIRHVPWSGDEVGLRPREHSVPTMMEWIDVLEADVVFLCFGMSESFDGLEGLPSFRNDLVELVERLQERGESASTLVLVSPIAHEDLGPPWPAGRAVAERNRVLSAYVAAMRDVAATHGTGFVDLFPLEGDATAPLTLNGIHPSEHGCSVVAGEIARQLGWMDSTAREFTSAEVVAAEHLRALACDKHYLFRLRYRPTNTEYVWGRRHEPFGIVNFPPEMAQLDRMVEARERAMWEMAKPSPSAAVAPPPAGPSLWERTPSSVRLPEDEWTPDPVEARGTETSLGDVAIADPDDFIESFKLPEGYVIECFASEQEFEELRNPLALAFDDLGRLWVLCAGTYPHLLPGERPRCQLLILDDADGDGRADRRTIFADGLYVPTGFAIDVDAVYVGQAPDLLRLTDIDGDDIADRCEIVASGFGMPDSHHQVSAFTWDPNGGFLMHEGVFTKSNVETPWGTRRTVDAAAWCFEPRTNRIEVMSHCGFSNPWGHVFDDYGQSVLADASGGDNHNFAQVISAFEYPRKPSRPNRFLNRGRPTAGCELISSRHFPDDVQDTFLVNQSIGFHGTRWDRIIPEGSGWRAARMPQDLLESSDTNFRPVAMQIGPDGALYIVDWCNPIIGHMQYSVRDPRRDAAHGRIWRVRHRSRALLEAPDIRNASMDELLELLRLPERNTRRHARRRLQHMPADKVLPAVRSWLAALAGGDPLHERLMIEALWIHQALGVVDLELATRVMSCAEPRARAAAVRVLRHWLVNGEVDSSVATAFLEQAVRDDDMRVRLEGVVAAGFLPSADGARVAGLAMERPMDDPMAVVLTATLEHLGRDGSSGSDLLRRVRLERLEAGKLVEETLDELVARVVLGRDDLPTERRLAALRHLAGDDPAAQVDRLVAELTAARLGGPVRALGALLQEHSTGHIAAVSEKLEALASAGNGEQRAAVLAVALRHRLGSSEMLDAEPWDLVNALALLPAGAAPQDALDRVLQAFERGSVEPVEAMRQLVRHAGDRDVLLAQIARHVRAAEHLPFSRWTPRHERALAALRGLHMIDRSAWPAAFERFAIASGGAEVIDRGRAIYADENTGCIRCHGADGRGLEGYPPLDRSPWVLGQPERAASIVVHGLHGTLRMPYGGVFASAMEPQGDLLSDDEIAAVLTFIRQSWGNFAPPVTPDHVAAVRTAAPAVGGSWEVRALRARYPLSSDGILGKVESVSHATRPRPSPGVFLGRLLLYLMPVALLGAVILIVARVRNDSDADAVS